MQRKTEEPLVRATSSVYTSRPMTTAANPRQAMVLTPETQQRDESSPMCRNPSEKGVYFSRNLQVRQSQSSRPSPLKSSKAIEPQKEATNAAVGNFMSQSRQNVAPAQRRYSVLHPSAHPGLLLKERRHMDNVYQMSQNFILPNGCNNINGNAEVNSNAAAAEFTNTTPN